MSLIISREGARRLGSLGKAAPGVDIKITEEGELAIRAEGCTPGYYKQPDKTAELIQDSWLHTGDRFRQDEDGFLYITGRIKDYFKTIQGKFVAPTLLRLSLPTTPMWSSSVWLAWDEQNHHGGRRIGDYARRSPRSYRGICAGDSRAVEQRGRKACADGRSDSTYEPRRNENCVLTPTLKIKRDQNSDR